MASKPARRSAEKKVTKKASKKAVGRGRAGKKAGSRELIISKSRTKAVAGINVSGDFYRALDQAVRNLIAGAEARAVNNNRRTLRPHDL